MSIYTKDKLMRITIRLDAGMSEFIQKNCSLTGQNPSEWVRMALHAMMYASNEIGRVVDNASKEMGRVIDNLPSNMGETKASSGKAAKRENKKTSLHNKLQH